MRIFYQNFLVMNGLYQLQQSHYQAETGYLQISAVNIQLLPLIPADDGHQITLNSDTNLRAYYLDWNNLYKTTPSDIEDLLKQFWSRFSGYQNLNESMQIIGVNPQISWDEMTQCYRRLLKQNHPDYGGDAEKFTAIREAYLNLDRSGLWKKGK